MIELIACFNGVEPTYKNVKGFQPLQMTCGRFIIDVVFRAGSKHCNHGRTVEKMVRHMVKKIRKACNWRGSPPRRW